MKTDFETSGQDPEALYLKHMEDLSRVAEQGIEPLLLHIRELLDNELQAGKSLINLEDMLDGLVNATDSEGAALFDKKLLTLNGAYPTIAEQEALGIDTMTPEIYGKCIIAGALTYFSNPARSAHERRLYLERFDDSLAGFQKMSRQRDIKPVGPAKAM